jgi:hypothetical protein
VAFLEVHHITNRNLLPKGGYVKENGITLCPSDHEKAEGGIVPAEVLYGLIGSNFSLALAAAEQA